MQDAVSVRHIAHKSSPSASTDSRVLCCYMGSDTYLWVIYVDDYTTLQESEVLKPLLSEWLAQIPANRLALLTDLQAAIVYLASEASDYISGHNLIIDGGHTRWWWDSESILVWMPSFVDLYSRFDFCVWSRDDICHIENIWHLLQALINHDHCLQPVARVCYIICFVVILVCKLQLQPSTNFLVSVCHAAKQMSCQGC